MDKQSEQQELKDIIATREDGFGCRFKTTRDEKNLSIEDVAMALHLDKKIILALESEDHTQLPVAAFVCGYIRNYAKLLNLQAEPLIEYYKNERSDNSLEPELKVLKGANNPSPSITSNFLAAIVMPLITVLVLLALAVGGWEVWLYVSKNHLNNDSSELIELDAVDSNADDTDGLLLPELNEYYEAPAEELIEKSSGSLPAEGSLPADGFLPADGSSSSESSLPVDGVLSAESIPSAEGSLPLEESLAAEGSLLAEGSLSVPVSESSEAVLVVDNQLILEFSGNSWVSIKDANNKILSTGLKKSSKILKLDGKVPYKVFLGDARVVKVSINGKVFDHSQYINEKNIARFNVK